MKILMLTASDPDPNSGVAGTEWQTGQALLRLGHEVDTIWADGLSRRIRHGNLYYLLELPWAFEKAIAAKVLQKQYDVIHVNQPYAWRAAKAHRAAKRPGVFVNRSHGWEPRVCEALAPWRRKFGVPDWRLPRGLAGRPMRWILHEYARWAATASDGVIVSTSEDREFIISRYGIPSDTVACIPQAPPPEFAQRPLVPMTPARSKRVLYVGQSGFFKGAHVLADVFSVLAKQHADLEFTWCTPMFEHDRCRALLAAESRDRVAFVDWMPQEELIDLYDQHGIFIFSTLAEGFGKVFLEAMSRGLCVVASNTSGMRDVIRHRETGCVVGVGNVEGFACEVKWLLAAPKRVREVSQAASTAAQGHTWDRVASETADFYGSLLRQHGLGDPL